MKQIKYTFTIATALISVLLLNSINAHDEPTKGKPNGNSPEKQFIRELIPGFESKYSPVTGRVEQISGLPGGVYSPEHYPPEMIEQIEMVEGGEGEPDGTFPGTVNMMTKRPAYNRFRTGYFGSVFGGAFDQQLSAVVELVTESGEAGLFIFGSTRERSSYDRDGDGFTEIGKLTGETMGVNGFFKPFDRGDLQISFHRNVEEMRNGSTLNLPAHESTLSDWTNHTKWGGAIQWKHIPVPSFSYSLKFALSGHACDSYIGGLTGYTPESRLQALANYGNSDNPLYTGTLQLKWVNGRHIISAGVQYDYEKLRDRTAALEGFHINKEYSDIAFFVQDELNFGSKDQLSVSAGARFDRHSSTGRWIISPKIDLVYSLSDAVKLITGYSTGFRAPWVHDEVLILPGPLATQRVLATAPELIEERSSTYTAGFEIIDFAGGIPVLFGMTASHTWQFNGFIDRFISRTGNVDLWQRENSEDATAWGLEFDFGIKPLAQLEIRSSLTLNSNPLKTEVENFNIKDCEHDHSGNLGISYAISDGFSIITEAIYTGSIQVPHLKIEPGSTEPTPILVDTNPFIELNVTVSKKLEIFEKVKTTLSFGVRNLTDAFQDDLDHGYTKDPGYIYGPSQPRTWFLNINLGL